MLSNLIHFQIWVLLWDWSHPAEALVGREIVHCLCSLWFVSNLTSCIKDSQCPPLWKNWADLITKGGTFLPNTCCFLPSEGGSFTVWHLDSPSFHLLFPRKEWIWVSLEERTRKAPPGPFFQSFSSTCWCAYRRRVSCSASVLWEKNLSQQGWVLTSAESRWVSLNGRLFAENGWKYSLSCTQPC